MIRTILSVVAGYAVASSLATLGFLLIWRVGGPDFAFALPLNQASVVWCVSMHLNVLAGAIGGGWVTGRLASPRAVNGLIGLLVFVGFSHFLVSLDRPPVMLPEGTDLVALPWQESLAWMQVPAWFNFGVPFVGALGAWVGSRLTRGRPRGQADAPSA